MFSISKLIKTATDCVRKVVEQWMGAKVSFILLVAGGDPRRRVRGHFHCHADRARGAGAKQAQLTIADNAIGSPRTVELTGTGT